MYIVQIGKGLVSGRYYVPQIVLGRMFTSVQKKRGDYCLLSG